MNNDINIKFNSTINNVNYDQCDNLMNTNYNKYKYVHNKIPKYLYNDSIDVVPERIMPINNKYYNKSVKSVRIEEP